VSEQKFRHVFYEFAKRILFLKSEKLRMAVTADTLKQLPISFAGTSFLKENMIWATSLLVTL